MQKSHEAKPAEIKKFIVGMRDAYAAGKSAIAFAHAALTEPFV